MQQWQMIPQETKVLSSQRVKCKSMSMSRCRSMMIKFVAVMLGFGHLIRSVKANDSNGAASGINNVLRKVHMPYANQHRIKVPIHTSLIDAIRGKDPRHRRLKEQRRHFEIEALDESSSISTLLVQEINGTAINPRTTYNFKRKLDADAIDFSILAHHSKEQMTILSVDKVSERVRGFHRVEGDVTRQITNQDGDRLHIRSLSEVSDRKEWSCGAMRHDHDKNSGADTPLNTDLQSVVRSIDSSKLNPRNDATEWRAPQKYSFNIDISIEVDARFIDRQGSAEKAVEYINFLVSAANLVFEHEVDAHLNVVHIEETDRFDSQTNAKEALSMMRMQQLALRSNSTYYQDGSSKFRLHHAVLGRYLGGGIAFIDSVCDKEWGFGVTSDISGNLENVDSDVLFDFFIFTHEVGHSLGSGHTFDDDYDPPIDGCAPCAMPGSNATVDGLPQENAGTIMSYCNFCDGGLPNIALTLGGEWGGLDPRNELITWGNSPFIKGDVSNDPRRVPHFIWEKLSSKELECIAPPAQLNEIQGCNDDSHCDDGNECTIDACTGNFCIVTESLPNCCPNRVCEPGELDDGCFDCGPFYIEPENYCEECFALDGFMFEVKLHEGAKKDIFINSVSFMHEALAGDDVTIILYSTLEGSYFGQEKTMDAWELLSTNVVSSQSSSESFEITINPPQRLNIGSARAFYLFASTEIILFGEGVYSIRNEHDVELYSSRAVSGWFGDGIDGFSLSCTIEYALNDSPSTPTSRPTRHPTINPAEPTYVELHKQSKGTQTPGRDSLTSHSSDEGTLKDLQSSSPKSEAAVQLHHLLLVGLLVLSSFVMLHYE